MQPRSEVCLDPVLSRDEPKLFEASNLYLSELIVREIFVCASSPQSQSLAQILAGCAGVTFRQGSASIHGLLETMRVDVLWINPEGVSMVSRHKNRVPSASLAFGFQSAPQARDVDPERFLLALRIVWPELLEDPFRRDDTIGIHEQEGKKGALLPRADINPRVPIKDLERSENVVLHAFLQL
jgi:hypothetical protein